MYFILILFFLSLLGILVMIGRKLMVIQGANILNLPEEESLIIDPNLIPEIKLFLIKNSKRYGYISVVFIIRLYVKGMHALKTNIEMLKVRFQEIKIKKRNIDQNMETSKFLKTISDYKRKIREIKERISEEENL